MPDNSDQTGWGDAKGTPPDDSRQRLLRIRRILERKIVPSLILDPSSAIPASTAGHDQAAQADAVLAMALQGREEQARAELAALARQGVQYETLQLGLLAEAAEKLGALWESDSVSFVDVTIATGTLQRLMHFVALEVDNDPFLTGRPRSICLFPEPDAEHTFGVSMAAKFFERAGWTVEYAPGANRQALRNIVRNRPVDVLGLSLGRRDEASRAGMLVDELVAASRNPDVVTVGGGSALLREPLLMQKARVDAVLTAVAVAPRAAEKMVLKRQK